MIFRQITHDDLGCASYLIGDERAGVAAVVDPRFEIDEYLELARYQGRHASSTCSRPTTTPTTSPATGASWPPPARASTSTATPPPSYEHEPFDDGWELELGSLMVRALHTPGHRPEHTAFALIDTDRGPEPWARADRRHPVRRRRRPPRPRDREVARAPAQIFRSLHDKLLTLPDDCEVWPGHLGGSMCGGPGMDMKISSTIGFEKRHNPALSIDRRGRRSSPRRSRSSGRSRRTSRGSSRSTAAPLLTERRRGGRRSTRTRCELKRDEGALLVDVRTDLQFDDVHIRGSICIPSFSAGFGSKLAWLADHDQEIVFIGRDDADGRRAGAARARRRRAQHRRPARRGHDQLAPGTPSGVADRAPDRRGPVRSASAPTRSCRCSTFASAREWDAGHIPGSGFMPWHDIVEIPAGLDPPARSPSSARAGLRAATAASLLRRHGAEQVIHVVDGGVPEWGRLGKPLERTPLA